MTETRRIDYAVAPDGKSVKITGQTHRGEEFTPRTAVAPRGDNRFYVTSSFFIESLWRPEHGKAGDRVFVRGSQAVEDNNPITGTPAYIARCVTAFDQYNAAFAEETVAAMQPPGEEEGSGKECFDCGGKIEADDAYCRTCGVQFLDDEDADKLLQKLVDLYGEESARPALHARLKRLIAGEVRS